MITKPLQSIKEHDKETASLQGFQMVTKPLQSIKEQDKETASLQGFQLLRNHYYITSDSQGTTDMKPLQSAITYEAIA